MTNTKEPVQGLVRTTLFEQLSSGVTYRIPALVYLSHSNTFLAFAEKRSSPSDHDAELLVMRRGTLQDDGSVQWERCEELSTAQRPNHRPMNPCPVFDKNTNALHLFFICVKGKITEQDQILSGINSARLCYVSSRDDGKTWSEAEDLTDSVIGDTTGKWATFAVGPGHGIQLESERLIIPTHAYCIPNKEQRALAIYSDDHGTTWQIGENLSKQSGECQMAEIVDHEGKSYLYCNARTFKAKRCEALSGNIGGSFDKPLPPSPQLLEQKQSGCQGSVIGFVPKDDDADSKTKTQLLFMHPNSESKRKDMAVYLNRSPLDSSKWEMLRIVHSGPSGYSDLVYNKDRDRFSALIECGKESELEQIAFISFSLSEVKQTTDNRAKCSTGLACFNIFRCHSE